MQYHYSHSHFQSPSSSSFSFASFCFSWHFTDLLIIQYSPSIASLVPNFLSPAQIFLPHLPLFPPSHESKFALLFATLPFPSSSTLSLSKSYLFTAWPLLFVLSLMANIHLIHFATQKKGYALRVSFSIFLLIHIFLKNLSLNVEPLFHLADIVYIWFFLQISGTT